MTPDSSIRVRRVVFATLVALVFVQQVVLLRLWAGNSGSESNLVRRYIGPSEQAHRNSGAILVSEDLRHRTAKNRHPLPSRLRLGEFAPADADGMLALLRKSTTTEEANGRGQERQTDGERSGNWTRSAPHPEVNRSFCCSYYENEHVTAISGFPLCENTLAVGRAPRFLFPLFGNPDTEGGGRRAPRVMLDAHQSLNQPQMSIVMSVYNAGPALEVSLPALFTATTGEWELLVVLDACYDNSLDVVRNLTHHFLRKSTCVRLRVIEQRTAVWETSSDNIGMRISAPEKAYVLLQPDIIITERGWNERMLERMHVEGAYEKRGNAKLLRANYSHTLLFAISGRCAHGHAGDSHIGRCDRDFAAPLPSNIDKNVLHVRETVNRGPLMLHAQRAQELGFLDETHFIMGNDDHDLMRRAGGKGYFAAYLPLGLYSPLYLSAQRNSSFRKHTPPDVKAAEHAYSCFRRKLRKEPGGYCPVTDDSGALQAPQLPSDVQVMTAVQGKSCDEACAAVKKKCSSRFFATINTCEMLRLHFGCSKTQCLYSTGPDQPCYVSGKVPGNGQFEGACLVNEIADWKCSGKHAKASRICPCIFD